MWSVVCGYFFSREYSVGGVGLGLAACDAGLWFGS